MSIASQVKALLDVPKVSAMKEDPKNPDGPLLFKYSFIYRRADKWFLAKFWTHSLEEAEDLIGEMKASLKLQGQDWE